MWDRLYKIIIDLITNSLTIVSEKFLSLIGALIFLFIGHWFIKKISRFLEFKLQDSKLDYALRIFVGKAFLWGTRILLIVSAAGIAGIQTTSFITALGAAGVAIGLALQGSLSNIAGSFLILFFRPFTIGDYIVAQGHSGIVEDISFFTTKLKTLDHQVIYLPNGSLANNPIQNLTQEKYRRVTMTVGIDYNDNIETARAALINRMKLNPQILFGIHPSKVVVVNLGNSSVDLNLHAWTESQNYWEVFYWLNENTKLALDEAKITIPYPQQVIHTK